MLTACVRSPSKLGGSVLLSRAEPIEHKLCAPVSASYSNASLVNSLEEEF
jgi:hypothetical protein